MSIRSAFVKPAAFAAVTCFGSAAFGQGAALSRFDPAERGSRFFVADSLELGEGHGDKARLATGIASTYALRTRVFGDPAEGENTKLVEHAFYLHPGASVAIAPGARFALDVPVAWQAGEDANLAQHRYAKPPSPRLGDIRVAFDLRALRIGRASLVGGVLGYLPTGTQEAFTGDDFVRFGLRVAATFREGPFHFAARVGYMYRRDGFVGSVPISSEVNGVLAAALESGSWFFGPEIWTSTFIDEAFAKRATPVDVLLGAHATFGDLRAGLAIGRSVTPALGSTYLRLALSFEWVPHPKSTGDRDRDGVPDFADPCPDVPGTDNGCPAVPTDRDSDGIMDDEDACPNEPGVRTRDPRTHGCPVPPAPPPSSEPLPPSPLEEPPPDAP